MIRDLRTAISAACVAGLMMMAATTADAAVVSITYTGTNAVGADFGGLFGTAGESLKGKTVSETFTFDTSEGRYFSDPTWAEVSYDPVGTPGYTQTLINVSVTVDGTTIYLPVDGTIRSIYNEGSSLGFQRVYTGYNFDNGSTTTQLGSVFWNQDVPVDLNRAFFSDMPGAGAPGSGGSFASIIINDNYTTGGANEAWMQFIPSSVLISVPEPKIWAMLIIGIAGTGLALRRRNRRQAEI